MPPVLVELTAWRWSIGRGYGRRKRDTPGRTVSYQGCARRVMRKRGQRQSMEIDAHTADAGIQTRLEAFLDLIENQRPCQTEKRPFRPATIGEDGLVTTSAGQQVALTDRRVKLHFPSFSHYHAEAMALAARWQGLNVGRPIELDRRATLARLGLVCGLRPGRRLWSRLAPSKHRPRRSSRKTGRRTNPGSPVEDLHVRCLVTTIGDKRLGAYLDEGQMASPRSISECTPCDYA